MPVRVYGNSSGGGYKGYPTADVRDIALTSSGGLKNLLKWTDPEDTVLDNAALATWQSTIIVRKENSVPESIKDGVVILENIERNQYQNKWYEDTNGLVDGHTYYYRFFTKSVEGVIGDGSPTVKMTAHAVDPVLANNSWQMISESAEAGAASEIWEIGDEIEVTAGGTWNQTFVMQIWDFEHYDKSDGSGKAGIVFGCKYLTAGQYRMHSDMYCYGWNVSELRLSTLPSLLSALPEEVKSVIKEVKIFANYTQGYGGAYKGEYADKIFIPNVEEMHLSYDTGVTGCGEPFPIFTDNESRKKKVASESGAYAEYRLRSGDESMSNFCLVSENGNWSAMREDYVTNICFCFCV